MATDRASLAERPLSWLWRQERPGSNRPEHAVGSATISARWARPRDWCGSANGLRRAPEDKAVTPRSFRQRAAIAWGGRRKSEDLADDVGQPGVAQAFLHREQDVGVARFDADYAVGTKRGEVQRRRDRSRQRRHQKTGPSVWTRIRTRKIAAPASLIRSALPRLHTKHPPPGPSAFDPVAR